MMPGVAGGKLTDKQALFVQEYLVDLNATQAAIRAGYSENCANEIGAENLSKPSIRDALQRAMDLRAERLQITQDRVLVELAKIGFADVRDLFTESGALLDPRSLNDSIAGAINSIEVVTKSGGFETDDDGNRSAIVEYTHKIKLSDKKPALELMGKHLKLFADRVEHTGANGQPISIIKRTIVKPE